MRAAKHRFLLALGAAALLPLLANEVPLVVWGGEAGIRVPFVGASDAQDRLWFGIGAVAVISSFGFLAAPLRTGLGVAALALALLWASGPEPVRATRSYWEEQDHAEAKLGMLDAPLSWGWRQSSPHPADHLRGPFETWSHPLGTDGHRRDVLVRLLYGARLSLTVALFAIALAGAIGVLLGVWGGWCGGRSDAVVRFGLQLFLCFPLLLVLLAFRATDTGPAAGSRAPLDVWVDIAGIGLILGVTRWTGFARLTRHQVQSVAGRDWVLALRALGLRSQEIVWRHILPHCGPPLLVHAVYGVIQMILLESALSFLGLGLPPPLPSLGGMMAPGGGAPEERVHLVVAAGLTMLAVLGGLHGLAARVARGEEAES